MKTKQSTKAAADAAIKRAVPACYNLWAEIQAISLGGDVQESMPKVRALLSELTQRVHEFNAYHNVLTTK